MSSFFNLTLDTLPPQNVTLSINGGAAYTNLLDVTLAIGTTDTPTTGYQMKIWGNVTAAATEAAAAWETFAPSKSVTLTTGDGMKTINVRLRDSVWNESAIASAQITLDTAAPVVTVTGPDVSVVSNVEGKNEAVISFTVDEIFTEYTVRVVPDSNALHTAGTQIPTTNGSVNMSGNNPSGFPANTAIECLVNGADLATAAGADGTHIIKVFAKDRSGTWSDV